jgi:hypothetical protein
VSSLPARTQDRLFEAGAIRTSAEAGTSDWVSNWIRMIPRILLIAVLFVAVGVSIGELFALFD